MFRKIISIVLSINCLLASEGEWKDTWLLSYDWGLLVWSIITFLIVLLILKAKAWGPLMDTLEKRERDIQLALEAADRAKADAAAVSKDYDEMIKKASGKKTIPQIFFNELHIGGYEELRALEKKGELDNLIK